MSGLDLAALVVTLTLLGYLLWALLHSDKVR
ncbi:hypothetical protein EV386_0600 [Xylanimonas ulmi]|uniref:Uncharacterized protein n=1 Tax=Xylanimonas ulmi TaxID=228973 RepID=A0A4Q7LYK8_9MICO|nr:hypothetical protein EV386_0600 [Xylanibacterium ulmi]